MTKTLQEELTSLSKPDDFDIENEDGSDGYSWSDSGLSSEDDTPLSQLYGDVPKSTLRQKNDPALGGKYSGAKSERGSYFGESIDESSKRSRVHEPSTKYSASSDSSSLSESSDSESESGAGEDKDGNKDEVENGNIGEDENSSNDSDSGASLRENSDAESESEDENHSKHNHGDNDSDSGASLRENSDSVSESEAEGSDSESSLLHHNRNKIKEMMRNERSHIVNRLSQSATSDAMKGFAVQQQHKLYDKILDTRIKLQKALTLSNLLPINTEAAQDHTSEKSEKYIEKAKAECYSLLDKVFAARKQMENSDVALPKKRTFSEYAKTANTMDSALNAYRGTVLTKWSAKLQNSSGASAINAGKFRAINQSFEQQVQNNLADMDRLIKRTKLNRRKITPMGYVTKEEEVVQEDPEIPQETKTAQMAELDEIFDDEDFYRVLLNDLVDRKIKTADPTSGMTISLRSAQQAQKFKKNVDTKGSKGRKLRYQVQEQIANFETPRSSLKWNDEQIDELFASLLGQKVDMKESEGEEEEEEDVVGADSFRLFG